MAFGEDVDLLEETNFLRGFAEALRGFGRGLVAEAEGAVVHRDEGAGAEFLEGEEGLLGVHVDVAFAGGLVGSDGQESNLDVVTVGNFFEKSGDVGAVAAVENGAVADFDEESAEAAVDVVEDAGTPMVGGREGDADVFVLDGFPDGEFVDDVEAEVLHEAADIFGDDDGLLVGDGAEGFFVEVVEMGVGDEDEVDVGEVVELESGVLDAFDDFEPLGPVGVDEDGGAGGLDEEGGVAGPGDADLIFPDGGKVGLEVGAETAGEEGGEQDLGEEVAFVPAGAGLHRDVMFGTASAFGDFFTRFADSLRDIFSDHLSREGSFL